jgi:hypothetical protein
MIADLKPYVEYKESGLPWLGQVPGHWETRRLRHACEMRVSNVDKHTKQGETPVRLCNYVEVYKNERIRESTRFMSASASEDERIRFCLRKGDVLITKDSEQWNDIGVPSLVEFEAPDLVCGYHLAILRARPLLHGPFLHRALECHFIAAQFHVEANGVTRYGLSHGAIQGVSIPLPPPTEQAAIVRFLDWANGRLERAIRAKRKVIALLTEQKQAIIHRAVTRGLDPSVPHKPSGIPWLGDIPQHWGVLRAKYLYREVDERSADGAQVYSPEQVQHLVDLFLAGAERDTLDPILDACVAVYTRTLDEDQQVGFKGKAKVFCRTYDFLASVMPYTNAEWEKLSILLNLLTPKLPAPKEEDLAKGILEAIDMDSYRVEKKAVMKIALADADAEIDPVPTDGGGRKLEPELDRLSNILKAFNEHFGTLFTDADRVAKRIREDIAPKVAADKAYQNAKENTPHTARMAHDQALGKAMQILLKDDTQVYKQFVENESFRRFVGDMVYELTSR